LHTDRGRILFSRDTTSLQRPRRANWFFRRGRPAARRRPCGPILYYGDGYPVGFCARNAQTGMMIDALVVPIPKPAATDKAAQDKATEANPQEAEEPKPNGRRRKKDEPAPEANGQAPPDEVRSAAEEQAGQNAKSDPVDGRSAKKARAKAS
jgi:hypothetical protein